MKLETEKARIIIERPDTETQELKDNFMLLQFKEDKDSISVKTLGKYSIAQLAAAYNSLGEVLAERVGKLSVQEMSDLIDSLS